jgi:short-subunit dehydrogenase
MQYKGMTALVTGSSAGLGEAFARQLAAQGANLILVARSEERLNRLAETLRGETGMQVTVFAADLSSADAVNGLIAEISRRHLKIDILVNNAGLGVFENILDTPFATQVEQVNVNVLALIALTHALAPGMIARHRGGVINIASTAAFQPLAGAGLYAASKAFVLFFSEALALELRQTGVTVTAACPGPIATHFFAKMNLQMQAKQMDQPGPVVNDILRGFERGKKVVYPGRIANRLSTWGARFLSRNMILRLAVGTTRKLNQNPRMREQR